MKTEEIKPGDQVFTKSLGRISTLTTVDRVTKSQIIVGNSRYNRQTGRSIGGKSRWSAFYIEFAAPEAIAAYEAEERHNSLVYTISKMVETNKLKAMPTHQLETLLLVLQHVGD
jgi:hypothetical protein